jgi:hypothetical protein
MSPYASSGRTKRTASITAFVFIIYSFAEETQLLTTTNERVFGYCANTGYEPTKTLSNVVIVYNAITVDYRAEGTIKLQFLPE